MTEGERIDDWDWLGNQVGWDDDASSFYERSLGAITNGRDEGDDTRPSALYFATNIDSVAGIESGWDGAGWVEVAYGDSGNVTSFTVHGECDDTTTNSCTDSPSSSASSRASILAAGCTCAVEQHYSYRWDELNRLVDARRYDRPGGTGDWTYQTRMRYRYDGANRRTVEESFAYGAQNTSHRIALTVYPGHFERRGLVRGSGTYDAQGSTTETDATETQYMIGGARIVWDAEPDTMGGEFDRNRRATIRASDLLGTTAAVLDIESNELLEVSTYYPSGARENLWTDDAAAPLEPIGFTGKEADEEIGAVYFGERWLIPRLGRWATPDPLHIHAGDGGEALNSYHYVSGNMLQATDPLGLTITPVTWEIGNTWHNAPTDYSAPSDAYVEELLGELRGTVIAEGLARASRLLDLADRGLMDSDAATAMAGEYVLRAHAEADAITYSGGHIQVQDLYGSARASGGRGAQLGGSVYERLRYVAESDQDVMIGTRKPEDITGDLAEEVAADRGAGYTIPWALHPRYQGNLPEAGVWYLSPDDRGPKFSTGGPRDTPAHELIIHVFRQFAGLNSSHESRFHARGDTQPDDGVVDAEAHFLWSFDYGETPPAHRHRGAPHPPEDRPLPYLNTAPTGQRRGQR
ncbi:MAG: RHS repeat-associated core domain-containing protein [Deltaproteobacteria bacterium]|nr:RHS repeat-associated core domain-containing protein [Deltaproteobacteria bacterium]